jgi:hypothetical protein
MYLQVGAATTGSATLKATSPNPAAFNLETKSFFILFFFKTKLVSANPADKT